MLTCHMWNRLSLLYIYSRRLEHSTLTAVGDRSWLNGFHPEDVDGCVVAAYVREDNTVALLKFQPE